VTEEESFRPGLTRLDPRARDALRLWLVADQPQRDAMAERLLREGGAPVAELLDLLSLYPESRRQVVRLLGEIEASG
jgi:hypothetical protein